MPRLDTTAPAVSPPATTIRRKPFWTAARAILAKAFSTVLLARSRPNLC